MKITDKSLFFRNQTEVFFFEYFEYHVLVLDDNFIFMFDIVDILATSPAGSGVTSQASGGSDLTIIEVRKVRLVSWNYYLS